MNSELTDWCKIQSDCKKNKIGAFENQNPQLGALSKVTLQEIYLLKY